MELKKSPESDLNKKRGLYLSIGFIVSLSITVLAFEWRDYDDVALKDLGNANLDLEELQEIPITEQPPPPPPKVIQQPEIIEVPDEEEIEEEIEVDLDIEVTEEEVIEEVIIDEEEEEEETDEVFLVVEDQPEPKGGIQAFYTYVNKSVKYPSQAKRMGVEGKVYVTFVVEKDGSLKDIKVLKGIGAGCDEEAVRVIKEAPKWKPGKQRGRPVKVRMNLPITFRLSS